MFCWHSLSAIYLWFFYQPPTFNTKHEADRKTKRQLLAEMDYLGLFLFTAGCTSFLIGINFGGRQYPWMSAAVIAPLVAGGVLLIILAFWECYADLKYPLLPPKLFRQFRG